MSGLSRFNGAAAWVSLSPGRRDELGPVLLELFVADAGIAFAENPVEVRPRQLAYTVLAAQLHELAGQLLPPELFDGGLAPVPTSIGPVCRFCGCSNHDACTTSAGPCRWVAEDLCSACAPGEAMADPARPPPITQSAKFAVLPFGDDSYRYEVSCTRPPAGGPIASVRQFDEPRLAVSFEDWPVLREAIDEAFAAIGAGAPCRDAEHG